MTISLKLIKKFFGSHFKFHSNFLRNISCVNDFPSFYLVIFCKWKKYFSTNPETPSCIHRAIVDNYFVTFTTFLNKIMSVQDHHLIRNTRVIVLDKLTAREIYSVLLLSSSNTPTSEKYFGKFFPNENFDWKKIYKLPRVFTINSFQRNFQYKMLYLRKMSFTFGKIKTPLC